MSKKIRTHGFAVAIKRTKKRLFIEVTAYGKLRREDYEFFVPLMEKAIKSAKGREVDLLVDMRPFKGWKPKAAWDDLRFGLKYRNVFDKMAVIGDKKWEKIALKLFAPLMRGETKFFKSRDKALAWLSGD